MTELIVDDAVHHSLDAGVARVQLNRPEFGNAVTGQQCARIVELLERASADPATRAVVISSTGKHFCTGLDLLATMQEAPDTGQRPPGAVGRVVARSGQRLVEAVLDCEKPVLAAVHGTAAGLGAHLAFACDLVLAADSAKFVEIFVRRGILPDSGGIYLLPRLIGLQKAKELMFFGDDLPADEACRIGLVNRVVPAEVLADTVEAWAARLAGGPTVALGLAKRLLNRSLDSDRSTALVEEALAQELTLASADATEGISAFLSRRPPCFTGA